MNDQDRVRRIIERLPQLTSYQLDSIDRIIEQLQGRKEFSRHPQSDIISEVVLQDFGDALRVHHTYSAEALSKDRFEYALEQVLLGRGIAAKRAAKGNPGHDITISKVPCSLKTQADKNIKVDAIHISKYMELGKGDWTDKLDDLRGLLARFYAHLSRYERIFTLRRLRHSTDELYELVEIPKELLEKAKDGVLSIAVNSRQNPKPGHCLVNDRDGIVEFELYFDGGTERKLQVRRLRKDLCTVHATWQFPRREADAEAIADEDRDL